jgi:PAS domain S-box-containing protein
MNNSSSSSQSQPEDSIDMAADPLVEANDRNLAEIQLELQNALLAQVANNEPLVNILNLTIDAVEKILHGAICSVLLLDSDNRLRVGAAPNLPPAYNQIVEGMAIGEGVGSCGTAAFRNETIIVTDIATDPLWQEYKEYMLPYGLQACWSMPINSSKNQVLGTFAVYYKETRSPQPHELKSIAQMVNILSIAIALQDTQGKAQGIFRDVTDLQQAAAALQASEAELRSLFMGIDDIVFVVDRVGTYLKIAPTNREKLMVPADNLLGKNVQDFFAPEQAAQFLGTIEQTLTTHQTQSCEYSLTIDDIEYWFNAKCSPLDDRSVIWVARDITEAKQEEVIRKQAEDLICQQAERAILLKEITQRIRQSLDLQTIFDTACQEIRDLIHADRVGIFKFDPGSHFDDGEFVAESVGAEFASAIAIRVKDHCFGENYAALYAKGRSYVVNDIYQNGDVACHTNILAQFQVRANLVMPLLCGDRLWGLLCIHQCAAPRNWQQSDIDLTQQIANQLTIAIQQANLFEQVQQELSQKQQAEVKLTETNHQLAVSNQELIRATRLKDEFLANMSHELRTPLNAILGLSESLLEEVFGATNDRQKKAISTVERSGQHLLSLINDILEVSKIEAGKLELEMTTVSATTLTNSTLAFVKQLAHQKQIQLTTSFAANLGNIDVDERRIRQVLINLLNNAVKFTPAGGRVTLEVQLEQAEFCVPTNTDLREQLDSGAWILFAVTDTGIGITPENQSKLFKPFVQIDGSLNRHYQGTGLGLTLVKQIVELHGGLVTLTSEFGQGSCFTVRLPYHAATEQQTILSPEPTPISITDSPEERLRQRYVPSIEYPLILLAEDNQDNIDTLCNYLEACNYRLILASNGYEAISLLESCIKNPADLPDLILMDIQMPGMDGLETMQRIRQDLQLTNLPIIALTALAMTGDREKCLAAGANDYLTKPIKLKQLRENIQRLIPVN